MIERIRSVEGASGIPPGSWALDSQVKYEWNKFVKCGSKYAYCEAKARAAALDEVKEVVAAVAESYSVCESMMELHIGCCFDDLAHDGYDLEGHYREGEVYDSDEYDSDGEFVGHNDSEDDGDSIW